MVKSELTSLRSIFPSLPLPSSYLRLPRSMSSRKRSRKNPFSSRRSHPKLVPRELPSDVSSNEYSNPSSESDDPNPRPPSSRRSNASRIPDDNDDDDDDDDDGGSNSEEGGGGGGDEDLGGSSPDRARGRPAYFEDMEDVDAPEWGGSHDGDSSSSSEEEEDLDWMAAALGEEDEDEDEEEEDHPREVDAELEAELLAELEIERRRRLAGYNVEDEEEAFRQREFDLSVYFDSTTSVKLDASAHLFSFFPPSSPVHHHNPLNHHHPYLEAFKSIAATHLGSLTESAWKRLCHIYPSISSVSLKTARRTLDELSDFKPKYHDKCSKGCVLFYGPYKDLDHCPVQACGRPRRKPDGSGPFAQTPYFPLRHRLAAMMSNPNLCDQLLYRARFVEDREPGVIRDVFDAQVYRRLEQEEVVVQGVGQGFNHFDSENDIAVSQSADGVAVLKRVRKKENKSSADVWPVLLVVNNLPPPLRSLISNLLPVTLLTGHPHDLHSFLRPLYDELDDIILHPILSILPPPPPTEADPNPLPPLPRRSRVYFLSIFGDLPASAAMTGFTGHNGRCPCSYCRIRGVLSGTHYYFPHSPHDGAPPRIPSDDIDVYDLPLRTTESVIADGKEADRLRALRDAGVHGGTTWFDQHQKATGVSRSAAVQQQVSGCRLPEQLGLEGLHCLYENTVHNICSMISEDYLLGGDQGTKSYRLSVLALKEIHQSLLSSSPLVPAAFGRPPFNIFNPKVYKTAEDYSSFINLYAPIVLQNHLPPDVYRLLILDYGAIIRQCTRESITDEEIDELERKIGDWVKGFEE